MKVKCLFCENDIEDFDMQSQATKTDYKCIRCGSVRLTEEAYDDFDGEEFSNEDKSALRIVLRNEYEMRNHILPQKYLTINDLRC